MGTAVPRQEGKGTYRADDNEEGSYDVEQLVGLVDEEYLLDKHLQHVGKDLQQAPETYTLRTDTALEVGADLTLHENQNHSNDGVCTQDDGANQHALYQYC